MSCYVLRAFVPLRDVAGTVLVRAEVSTTI